MSIESEPTQDAAPRTDLLSALAWIAFGALVAVMSWRMDRLENLNINRYEVPGLVPGLLGTAILLLGIVLAVRSVRRGALHAAGATAPRVPGERRYMAVVIGSMLAYAVVLVGHGIPFWLATLLFVTAFIFFFDRDRQRALGRGTGQQALLALVYGAATSAIVSFAFQEIFYVRLP